MTPYEAFLESLGSRTSSLRTRHHVSVLTALRIYLQDPPTRLNLNNQSQAPLPFSVTPSVKRHLPSTGILTCYPSTTPFGLALGSDLPWEDSPGPGTLGFSAGEILALLLATHAISSSCDTSSCPCRSTFVGVHNAPLPYVYFYTHPYLRYIA